MLPGEEPLSDDEIVYRRVPESYYPEPREGRPHMLAFRPREDDTDGLSVSRAKHCSIEAAARGGRTKLFFVAMLSVGELRSLGLDVVPDPKEGNPGHAIIPQLRSETGKHSHVLELQRMIAERYCRMEGPF